MFNAFIQAVTNYFWSGISVYFLWEVGSCLDNKILLYGVSWEQTFGSESLYVQKRLFWLCSSCDSWFTPIFLLLNWLASLSRNNELPVAFIAPKVRVLFSFWIMTSLEEKISILKMQILSSQVQSTLLRSSSFKLQINLNVLSLDMKYVTNIFEKNANFPVWAVFHKTYVIRWFERKNLSLWMGSGKVTRCCYISIDYFWHLGTYSSKLAIFYKSIGIAEQRKQEAKLGAVKFESLKFSLITFIF